VRKRGGYLIWGIREGFAEELVFEPSSEEWSSLPNDLVK
jgi:hypothetical protein